MTWLIVDGENIDATLGGSILGRRPHSEERPRWDRLLAFAERTWEDRARGLFFLNASTSVPMPFVQALTALGYEPVLLSGPADVKVVDVAIQRTLRALRDSVQSVILVSHDADFVDDVAALADGVRRVGVLSFTEFRSTAYAAVPNLTFFDLEYDADAFDAPLPRIRVIPIDEFDPAQFLR